MSVVGSRGYVKEVIKGERKGRDDRGCALILLVSSNHVELMNIVGTRLLRL